MRWWNDRPNLGCANKKTRYSLIISLKTPEIETDIYTPVKNMISIPIVQSTQVIIAIYIRKFLLHYPKIVLNKMEFLKKMKNKELKEEKVQLEHELKGKYYNLKHKNPTENTAISKFFFMDDFVNLKYGKYLTRPKVMVNNNMVSKLKYEYDFM